MKERENSVKMHYLYIKWAGGGRRQWYGQLRVRSFTKAGMYIVYHDWQVNSQLSAHYIIGFCPRRWKGPGRGSDWQAVTRTMEMYAVTTPQDLGTGSFVIYPYLWIWPSRWSRGISETLIGPQLVNKFPVLYGSRRFITVFRRARHTFKIPIIIIVIIIPFHTTNTGKIISVLYIVDACCIIFQCAILTLI